MRRSSVPNLLVSMAAVLTTLGTTGCAALFRDSKPPVRVISDPPGGSVETKEKTAITPVDIPVPRSGVTFVRVTMAGFEEHRGTIRKPINTFWLLTDLGTCIVPVLLCAPLLIDAISGAWYDVQPVYQANLVRVALAQGAVTPPPARPSLAPPLVVEPPANVLSESERKASARAEYQEGMELQSKASYAAALLHFQEAQRAYDAPTHLLHIAQCLALTGKLVEAQETYETLTHRALATPAPEPFVSAVAAGRLELTELRPRIPTLRISVHPDPAELQDFVLKVDGRPVSSEIVGIARPMNPGTYRVTATAKAATARPITVTLDEGSARVIELQLGR